MKTYKKLTKIQKKVIGFLAIHSIGFTNKDFYRFWNLLYKYNGKPFPSDVDWIKTQTTYLISQNLIVKEKDLLFCNQNIQFMAVADMFMEKEFSRLATVLLEAVSFDQTIDQIEKADVKAYFRCMQISLFLNFSPTVLIDLKTRIQKAIIKKGTPEYALPNFFKSMFASPFQPQLINAIKYKFQGFILNLVMEEVDVYTHLSPEFLAFSCDFFTDYSSTTNLSTLAKYKTKALDLFLQLGMFDQYQRILKTLKKDSPEAYSIYRGCLLFLQGNTKDSIKNFEIGILGFSQIPSLEDKHWGELPMILFLFAILKTNDRAQHGNLLSLIDLKTDNLPEVPLMFSLFYEAYEKNKKFNLDKDFFEYVFTSYKTQPIYWLFNVIFIFWKNKKQALEFGDTLEDFFNRVSECEYSWVAAEIAMLLGHLGIKPDKYFEYGKNTHKIMGTHTILEAYKPQPVWKQKLQALKDIADNKESKALDSPVDTSQRIVWKLQWPQTLENHKNTSPFPLPQILPILQKRAKNGSWTKGRGISLKSLYQNSHKIIGMSPLDQKVCAAIHEYNYKPIQKHSYYQPEYTFDVETAMEALIGHNLVFSEESGQTIPVELIEGKPELQLIKVDNITELKMNPADISPDTKLILMKETISRIRVIKLNERHHSLFNILGQDGLQIPEEANDHATSIIGNFASIINISSNFNIVFSNDTEKISADSSPHVLITPSANGVIIEFRVRPFKETGPYYRPGQGGQSISVYNIKQNQNEIQNQEPNSQPIVQRDLDQEIYLMEKILKACPNLVNLENNYHDRYRFQIADPETSLEVLFELKNCKEKMIIEWPRNNSFSLRSSVGFEGLSLGIQKHKDWFKASGSLDIDKDLTLDLKQILSMMDKSVGRFIPLDDGSFIGLTQHLKNRLEELKLSLYSDRKELLFSPLAQGGIEDILKNAAYTSTDEDWKAHCKSLRQTVSPKIPSSIKALLRPYQKEGFKWLAQLMHWKTGACLADDMGLGKTLQALCALLLCAEKGPSLVVAPVSVMSNWKEECEKFAPKLNPKVFHSGNRKEDDLKNLGPFDLLITSYGLLQTGQETLQEVQWQGIVLDEAQAIKNMNTKRSRAAMKLNGKFRLITTGTPLENHLSELWTLFRFINPGLLGPYQQFRRNFAIPIERDQDKTASRCLKKLIQPFILRRLKSDVLTELPQKTEITIHVEMSKEEIALYEAQRLQSIENVNSIDSIPKAQQKIKILAELTRLRKLCCHPDLILPESGIKSSKLKMFSDIIDELLANRHKILIFSQFVSHLAILKNFLDNKKIGYLYLDGSTPEKYRRQRINSFQEGQEDLFLISLKAGGTGLNLTAADYVIHMDPWWNPAVEDQASDRAHRIGQSKPVTVYRLVLKGTIEDQILGLHKEKRSLAQDLLAGTENAGKISAEKLMELLHEGGFNN